MGVRLVDPGNIVHANDQGAIAMLTKTQPSAVLFTLPAHTLDDVRDAMARGPVEVSAYDHDNRRALSTGTLLTVDNLIEQATATYQAQGDVRQQGREAVARRVRQCAAPARNPATRLSSQYRRAARTKGLFTWVVKPDNTVEARPIKTSPTTGDMTIVTAGSMTASAW